MIARKRRPAPRGKTNHTQMLILTERLPLPQVGAISRASHFMVARRQISRSPPPILSFNVRGWPSAPFDEEGIRTIKTQFSWAAAQRNREMARHVSPILQRYFAALAGTPCASAAMGTRSRSSSRPLEFPRTSPWKPRWRGRFRTTTS